jgi:hypothetical protein
MPYDPCPLPPLRRDVVLFGRKVLHIPPMCKLNPLYDQVVALRCRAPLLPGRSWGRH